jgi:HAD superfamily hydrolase (TIGR01509 family)
MIQAIIFDFFGVIRTDGYNRWLKEHGQGHTGAFLTASERHDRGELSEEGFFQAISEASGEPVGKIKQSMESGNELNELLVQYIGKLRTTYKIVLLSNSASDYLRAEIKKYGLEKYFDHIVISSEVGMIKPELKIFEYSLNTLGLKPDQAIFIDDNPKDVASAEVAGIRSIVYTNVAVLQKELDKLLVKPAIL